MILLTGIVSAFVVIVYIVYELSQEEKPPALDVSHPIYGQAQNRANLMQRAQAITYNKLLKSYSIKPALDAWPSDEDYIVGVVQSQPNKRTLKLVYSK